MCVFGFCSPRGYNLQLPIAHPCLVSFTDTNNIRHAVEVAATTLYEAATVAMAEFRRCGFTDRLWRDLAEAAQRNFRWEERLRHAQDCQDLELARVLVAKLEDLARERTRMNQALGEHEARLHSQPK